MPLDSASHALKSGKCSALDAICERKLARRRGGESGTTKIVIGFEEIFPRIFVKLKIDTQTDGDIVAVL